jgi:tryptophan synthase alpha subunit
MDKSFFVNVSCAVVTGNRNRVAENINDNINAIPKNFF